MFTPHRYNLRPLSRRIQNYSNNNNNNQLPMIGNRQPLRRPSRKRPAPNSNRQQRRQSRSSGPRLIRLNDFMPEQLKLTSPDLPSDFKLALPPTTTTTTDPN